MDKNSWLFMEIVLLLFFLFLFLTGCAVQQPPVTTPGSGLVTKIIVQNNWLLTLSILGIGAGFFAFLNGNSKGISIMASCFVVMSVILMIAKFAIWLGVITLIGAVSLVAYTVLVRNRAFKEVVKGVQQFKETGLHDTSLGEILQKQTKQTKKLVKKIKDKLPC